MDNLGYLFAAFACIWLFLLLYIVRLARRQNALIKEIQQLQEQLKDNAES